MSYEFDFFMETARKLCADDSADTLEPQDMDEQVRRQETRNRHFAARARILLPKALDVIDNAKFAAKSLLGEKEVLKKRICSIAQLRELGGEWRGVRRGFGWVYAGKWLGHSWVVASYAQLHGDDENFDIVWTVVCDGNQVASGFSPLWYLESYRAINDKSLTQIAAP